MQDINKELVFKKYGFTDNVLYKQVFDNSLSELWIEGNEVLFDSESYVIRLVNGQMAKMGSSNHKYVIMSRV